jgi:hypothetical protein
MARSPVFGGLAMANTSSRQKRTIGRVMHEYAHGELKSGEAGKAGKVKSRKQAIAIALDEAGASRTKRPTENRKAEARTERKEARGETYQQEKEGKSHRGASGRRKNSANGRKTAVRKAARKKKAPRHG